MTTIRHKVLYLTERSLRHQQDALAVAPPDLDITMLRQPPRDEILRLIGNTAFLISERVGEIDAEIIAAGKQLRLIQRLGSLTYDIDIDAAQRAGIPVCGWPIRLCILVAEHLILQMLALVKKLNEVQALALAAGDWGRPAQRTDEDTFAYNWTGRTDIDGIYGKAVGILGLGEIGAELARRLLPFAPASVLYYKRRPLPTQVEQELGLTYASRDALIAQSDFLCCLLPFSPETEQSLTAATFAAMKPGSFLVHCGSGNIIDETALAAALQNRHLGGAALDTYTWEPLQPHNPLLALARDPAMNLLLTPHTAAGARPAGAPSSRNLEYTNVQRLLTGEPLLYLKSGRYPEGVRRGSG